MRFLLTLSLAATFFACTPPQETQDKPEETQVNTPSDLEPFTELYDSGQIRIKGWTKNGEREGRWMSFYENGVRWSEDTYRNGKKDGPTKTYYRNGILKYTGIYLEDRKVGTWNFYNESGKLVEAKDYNP